MSLNLGRPYMAHVNSSRPANNSSKTTPQLLTALLALHAFTHCDTTSAFRGIGKKKPIKVMQKFPSTNPSCQSSDLSGWSLRSCLLAGRNSHVPYMVDQGSRTLTDSGTPSSRRSVMKAIGYGLA